MMDIREPSVALVEGGDPRVSGNIRGWHVQFRAPGVKPVSLYYSGVQKIDAGFSVVEQEHDRMMKPVSAKVLLEDALAKAFSLAKGKAHEYMTAYKARGVYWDYRNRQTDVDDFLGFQQEITILERQ